MMEDNVRKRMDVCICDWVTVLYRRKLTEHCKPTIMEKTKIIINKKREKEKGISMGMALMRGSYERGKEPTPWEAT